MNWKKTAALVLASVFILSGCAEKENRRSKCSPRRKEENRHEAITVCHEYGHDLYGVP